MYNNFNIKTSWDEKINRLNKINSEEFNNIIGLGLNNNKINDNNYFKLEKNIPIKFENNISTKNDYNSFLSKIGFGKTYENEKSFIELEPNNLVIDFNKNNNENINSNYKKNIEPFINLERNDISIDFGMNKKKDNNNNNNNNIIKNNLIRNIGNNTTSNFKLEDKDDIKNNTKIYSNYNDVVNKFAKNIYEIIDLKKLFKTEEEFIKMIVESFKSCVSDNNIINSSIYSNFINKTKTDFNNPLYGPTYVVVNLILGNLDKIEKLDTFKKLFCKEINKFYNNDLYYILLKKLYENDSYNFFNKNLNLDMINETKNLIIYHSFVNNIMSFFLRDEDTLLFLNKQNISDNSEDYKTLLDKINKRIVYNKEIDLFSFYKEIIEILDNGDIKDSINQYIKKEQEKKEISNSIIFNKEKEVENLLNKLVNLLQKNISSTENIYLTSDEKLNIISFNNLINNIETKLLSCNVDVNDDLDLLTNKFSLVGGYNSFISNIDYLKKIINNIDKLKNIVDKYVDLSIDLNNKESYDKLFKSFSCIYKLKDEQMKSFTNNNKISIFDYNNKIKTSIKNVIDDTKVFLTNFKTPHILKSLENNLFNFKFKFNDIKLNFFNILDESLFKQIIEFQYIFQSQKINLDKKDIKLNFESSNDSNNIFNFVNLLVKDNNIIDTFNNNFSDYGDKLILNTPNTNNFTNDMYNYNKILNYSLLFKDLNQKKITDILTLKGLNENQTTPFDDNYNYDEYYNYNYNKNEKDIIKIKYNYKNKKDEIYSNEINDVINKLINNNFDEKNIILINNSNNNDKIIKLRSNIGLHKKSEINSFNKAISNTIMKYLYFKITNNNSKPSFELLGLKELFINTKSKREIYATLSLYCFIYGIDNFDETFKQIDNFYNLNIGFIGDDINIKTGSKIIEYFNKNKIDFNFFKINNNEENEENKENNIFNKENYDYSKNNNNLNLFNLYNNYYLLDLKINDNSQDKLTKITISDNNLFNDLIDEFCILSISDKKLFNKIRETVTFDISTNSFINDINIKNNDKKVKEEINKLFIKLKSGYGIKKSPITRTRSKSPIIASRSKSPVVRSRSKSPIISSRSKSPITASRSKSPITSSRSKSPITSSKSKSKSESESESSNYKDLDKKVKEILLNTDYNNTDTELYFNDLIYKNNINDYMLEEYVKRHIDNESFPYKLSMFKKDLRNNITLLQQKSNDYDQNIIIGNGMDEFEDNGNYFNFNSYNDND